MMRKKSAQAALEFLTTYSWAILIILVMIGALAYFGVLNPSKLLPDTCNFGSEISCSQYVIKDNGFRLKLKNNVGSVITVDSLTASTKKTQLNCASSIVSATWRTGEIKDVPVVCNFADAGLVEGEKEKINLEINYHILKGGSTFSKSVQGEVFTGIGSGALQGLGVVEKVFLMLINQPTQDGNLLNSSTWVVGSTGSQPGFSQNGQTSENSIELGIGPYGKQVALWKGGNDVESNADGGWNTPIFTVDPSKSYMYTVWVKKMYLAGTTYFGLESNVGLLGGGLQSNPYFWCGQVLEANKWYLIVGYIRPYDTPVTTGGVGGVYDGVTKQKVFSFTTTTGNCNSDFKHSGPGDTTQNHRAYLYYDTNVNNRQWFYDPRVEEINSLNSQ